MSKNELLEKMATKMNVISNIKKRQLKFIWHIIRKDSLENLLLSSQIEDKRERGKQRIVSLSK